MISLSVSSETPAERPNTSSGSDEVKPRRALEEAGDEAGSPSTPVRLQRRARRGTEGTEEADRDDWSWELPPSTEQEPATPRQPAETPDPSTAESPRPDAGYPRRQPRPDQADDTMVRPAPKAPIEPANEPVEKAAAETQPTQAQQRTTADAPPTKAPEKKAPAKKAAAKKAAAKKAATQPAKQQPAQQDAPAKKAATKKAPGANAGGPAKQAAAKKTAAKKAGGNRPGGKKGGNKNRRGQKGEGQLSGRRKMRVLQGMGRMEPRPEIPDQSHLPPEQRTDLAVRVSNLHITYRTSFEKRPTLKQALTRFGRGQRAVREVEALKDVSFEVRTGTAMGIIGANGAGKSTLMRAMAGILPPTDGSVEVWGKASTLLALGVGFNNSLSGRENIILGGLAAGLSRDQVEQRAAEIADWTELGDFIDMPMRTYSSGMFSRVSFSVAVHMEPDILMIDEALSTGDAHFKEKASAKMTELRSRARAMFLVSHGLGSIREMCDEAIWIDKGRLMERGEPADVISSYTKFLKVRRSATTYEDL